MFTESIFSRFQILPQTKRTKRQLEGLFCYLVAACESPHCSQLVSIVMNDYVLIIIAPNKFYFHQR